MLMYIGVLCGAIFCIQPAVAVTIYCKIAIDDTINRVFYNGVDLGQQLKISGVSSPSVTGHHQACRGVNAKMVHEIHFDHAAGGEVLTLHYLQGRLDHPPLGAWP